MVTECFDTKQTAGMAKLRVFLVIGGILMLQNVGNVRADHYCRNLYNNHNYRTVEVALTQTPCAMIPIKGDVRIYLSNPYYQECQIQTWEVNNPSRGCRLFNYKIRWDINHRIRVEIAGYDGMFYYVTPYDNPALCMTPQNSNDIAIPVTIEVKSSWNTCGHTKPVSAELKPFGNDNEEIFVSYVRSYAGVYLLYVCQLPFRGEFKAGGYLPTTYDIRTGKETVVMNCRVTCTEVDLTLLLKWKCSGATVSSARITANWNEDASQLKRVVEQSNQYVVTIKFCGSDNEFGITITKSGVVSKTLTLNRYSTLNLVEYDCNKNEDKPAGSQCTTVVYSLFVTSKQTSEPVTAASVSAASYEPDPSQLKAVVASPSAIPGLYVCTVGFCGNDNNLDVTISCNEHIEQTITLTKPRDVTDVDATWNSVELDTTIQDESTTTAEFSIFMKMKNDDTPVSTAIIAAAPNEDPNMLKAVVSSDATIPGLYVATVEFSADDTDLDVAIVKDGVVVDTMTLNKPDDVADSTAMWKLVEIESVENEGEDTVVTFPLFIKWQHNDTAVSATISAASSEANPSQLLDVVEDDSKVPGLYLASIAFPPGENDFDIDIILNGEIVETLTLNKPADGAEATTTWTLVELDSENNDECTYVDFLLYIQWKHNNTAITTASISVDNNEPVPTQLKDVVVNPTIPGLYAVTVEFCGDDEDFDIEISNNDEVIETLTLDKPDDVTDSSTTWALVEIDDEQNDECTDVDYLLYIQWKHNNTAITTASISVDNNEPDPTQLKDVVVNPTIPGLYAVTVEFCGDDEDFDIEISNNGEVIETLTLDKPDDVTDSSTTWTLVEIDAEQDDECTDVDYLLYIQWKHNNTAITTASISVDNNEPDPTQLKDVVVNPTIPGLYAVTVEFCGDNEDFDIEISNHGEVIEALTLDKPDDVTDSSTTWTLVEIDAEQDDECVSHDYSLFLKWACDDTAITSATITAGVSEADPNQLQGVIEDSTNIPGLYVVNIEFCGDDKDFDIEIFKEGTNVITLTLNRPDDNTVLSSTWTLVEIDCINNDECTHVDYSLFLKWACNDSAITSATISADNNEADPAQLQGVVEDATSIPGLYLVTIELCGDDNDFDITVSTEDGSEVIVTLFKPTDMSSNWALVEFECNTNDVLMITNECITIDYSLFLKWVCNDTAISAATISADGNEIDPIQLQGVDEDNAAIPGLYIITVEFCGDDTDFDVIISSDDTGEVLSLTLNKPSDIADSTSTWALVQFDCENNGVLVNVDECTTAHYALFVKWKCNDTSISSAIISAVSNDETNSTRIIEVVEDNDTIPGLYVVVVEFCCDDVFVDITISIDDLEGQLLTMEKPGIDYMSSSSWHLVEFDCHNQDKDDECQIVDYTLLLQWKCDRTAISYAYIIENCEEASSNQLLGVEEYTNIPGLYDVSVEFCGSDDDFVIDITSDNFDRKTWTLLRPAHIDKSATSYLVEIDSSDVDCIEDHDDADHVHISVTSQYMNLIVDVIGCNAKQEKRLQEYDECSDNKPRPSLFLSMNCTDLC